MTNKEKAQMIQGVIDHPGRERTYYSLLEDMGDLKFTFAFISEGSGRFQYILSPFKKIIFSDGAGRYVFSSLLEDCHFDSADVIQVIECL